MRHEIIASLPAAQANLKGKGGIHATCSMLNYPLT
jgi:hypothetical protein